MKCMPSKGPRKDQHATVAVWPRNASGPGCDCRGWPSLPDGEASGPREGLRSADGPYPCAPKSSRKRSSAEARLRNTTLPGLQREGERRARMMQTANAIDQPALHNCETPLECAMRPIRVGAVACPQNPGRAALPVHKEGCPKDETR